MTTPRPARSVKTPDLYRSSPLEKHHHGGLGLHTAADIHYGRAAAVRAGRAQVLDAAYLAHPERFVRKPPAPPKLPGTSWINPPPDKETGTQ
jgi:putative transposase